MVDRLGLGPDSLVTEVASNDGYLLQHFLAAGIPVVGVEPAANIAEVARAKGIRTEVRFLGAVTGAEVAGRYGRADLVAANNVYAHVPDIRDFTAGLAALVKPTGLVTLELPHLLRLIERRQYDTIYHEHYQYLTLLNHCGIQSDLLAYTVDRSPYKQGRFLPGTHIPIRHPDRIAADRPDYVLVLPWNLRTELTAQLSYVGDWGGRLVFPIPQLEVVRP